MGYARPIAKGDERIPVMEEVQKNLKIPFGPHQRLAHTISDTLQAQFDESMNFNGYTSAVLADLNYSPMDAYRISCLGVSSGVTACYVDTMDKPSESFFTQRCSDINYTGKALRQLPE